MHEILELKNSIETYINTLEINKAEEILKSYEEIYPYDMDIIIYKANILFLKNEYYRAKQLLEDSYYMYEYNHEINNVFAVALYFNGEYKKSMYYFLKALVVNDAENKEDNGVQPFIDDIRNIISDEEYEEVCNELKDDMNLRIFPKKECSGMQYGKLVNEFYGKKYYCGIYDYYYPERSGLLLEQLNNPYILKTECIPARIGKMVKYKCSDNIVVPIMVKENYQNVTIEINNEKSEMKNLIKNRFYYYKFNSGENVKIKSGKELIIGDKIELKKNKKMPSLIINIFIDGLSQKFIEENKIEEVIPNIYNFFKEGTICNNSYVSGDWTYVSLASFFTGKYTTNHRVFHGKYETLNLYDEKFYSEILQREGYFCSKIDGDWRSNPSMGFTKGFNRIVYQPSVMGMHCDQIITETIEQIEAFKDVNNYLWVSIPDLHDIADEYETRLITQINNSVKSRCFEKTGESSAKKKYDEKKYNRYKVQLKRIDTYLQMLFDYIKNNYDEDDYLINLVSDHGQAFLVNSDEFIDEEKTKVPLMFRGKGVKKGTTDEIISASVDLFPIMFKILNIENFNLYDANIPKYFGGDNSRKFAIAESMYNNQKYYAALYDNENKFFFETEKESPIDGRIDIEGYTVKLINKTNGNNITKDEINKVREYTNKVIDHIKRYIIYK